MRDRLWFYLSGRYNGYQRFAAGAVFADGTPVGTHPMQGNHSFITRVTWQATQANKFRLYLDKQYNGEDYNNVSTTIAPEAAQQAFGGGWTPQVKWTSTPTNRLLLDAGITLYTLPYGVAYQDSVGPLDVPHLRIDHQQTHRGDDESLHQLDRQLRDGRVGVLRDGHARHQDRDDLRVGHELHDAIRARRDSAAQLQQQHPPLGDRAQHAVYGHAEGEVGLRLVRPGRLDDEAAHAQLRRPVRSLQLRGAEALLGSDALGSGRPRLRGDRECSELERLGDPPGGFLRPVRDRQDGVEGERQQVHGRRSRQLRGDFNPMGRCTDTRAWTDLDNNRTILDANGNIQYNEVAAGRRTSVC